MHNGESVIVCPIFQKQKGAIKTVTDKINKTKKVKEKAVFAEELIREAVVLLACDEADKSSNCRNCHFIAALHRRAASLIIKAKKLA